MHEGVHSVQLCERASGKEQRGTERDRERQSKTERTKQTDMQMDALTHMQEEKGAKDDVRQETYQ